MNRASHEQGPNPRGGATGSSRDIDPLGFDLPDADWLMRIRRAESPAELGRIGPYVLIEEIGRGAQGIVYRARQPNTNRDIAIKRLVAGQFASGATQARFTREIEAASALTHPNLVRVYGTEMVGDQPVLAMEWIDGIPADAWAVGRAPADVLNVFATICDAVHYAHQR